MAETEPLRRRERLFLLLHTGWSISDKWRCVEFTVRCFSHEKGGSTRTTGVGPVPADAGRGLRVSVCMWKVPL